LTRKTRDTSPGYRAFPFARCVYPEASRLTFARAESQPSLARPLCDCSSGSPRATGKELRFLYGAVAAAPARHGWIAEPSLTPGP
jgi:hypothetical protein